MKTHKYKLFINTNIGYILSNDFSGTSSLKVYLFPSIRFFSWSIEKYPFNQVQMGSTLRCLNYVPLTVSAVKLGTPVFRSSCENI